MQGGSEEQGSTTDSSECGNGIIEPGEACDDSNGDPTDGCLSSCVVPRSCAEVLVHVPGVGDDAYLIAPDGLLLPTWCDMTTDGGGWSLLAKVNPADQDSPPRSRPVGWLAMELAVEQLQTPDLVLNGPLASLGSTRFEPIISAGTVARVELVAADDFSVRVAWYKEVIAPDGLNTWFDFSDMPSEVCTDAAMTMNCSAGTIAPTGGGNSPTILSGMELDVFGYTAGFPIHMRLSDDGSTRSGVNSSTLDNDGNAWPDSYSASWGNALLIWIRE